jgi:hypothetical protein
MGFGGRGGVIQKNASLMGGHPKQPKLGRKGELVKAFV